MKYQVRWKRTAKDQLATIRMNSRDRAAVTRAAQQIDALLQTNPATRGESRTSSRRILVMLPLAVIFKVQEQEEKVTVLSVRYTPPRMPGA